VESQDLRFIVEPQGSVFIVLESPRSADDEPDYRAIAATTLRAEADAIVAKRTVTYWN